MERGGKRGGAFLRGWGGGDGYSFLVVAQLYRGRQVNDGEACSALVIQIFRAQHFPCGTRAVTRMSKMSSHLSVTCPC